ncbi:MAG: hypothetical protein R3C71_10950 [Candidatus Krumholzibacteriia bacterium]|nr:PD40 domain-containing protein [bacterium]
MLMLSARRAAVLGALVLLLTPAVPRAQEAPDTSQMTPLQKLILKARQQAGTQPSAESDTLIIPAGVTRLTGTPGDEGKAAWSPDGQRLYYEYFEHGTRRIVRREMADGSVTALTDSLSSCRTPAISPDEQYMVFVRDVAALPTKLWIMRLEDGEIAKLTEEGGNRRELDPAYSHSGGAIYFAVNPVGRANAQPMLISRDGSNEEVLADAAGSWQSPAPSPSGKKIAWSLRMGNSGTLRIMDAKVNALVEPFEFPGHFISSASWLRGERKLVVAYLDQSDARAGYDLGIVDLDTGELTPWIDMTNAIDPVVSPDGSQVVFRARVDKHYELFLAKAP